MNIYPPGSMIGQYEVVSSPMMGGMGLVYFCLDRENEGRPVALKTFRPELLSDRAARDRFLREGSLWMEIKPNPHVVRCYKVVNLQGLETYLILELIAAEQGHKDASLRSWLKPGYPLKIEQALSIAIQVTRGMRHVNELVPNFVHRDLKPENILIGIDKLSGWQFNRVRVTDFGLASFIESLGNLPNAVANFSNQSMKLTHLTQGVIGTPLYMAPEQWRMQKVGVYTDIYALGCILGEMISGTFVIKGNTVDELNVAHCSESVLTFPDDLSHSIKNFVKKCLSKEPNERYQEWKEVESALVTAYCDICGSSVAEEITPDETMKEDRISVGWSNIAIGDSYQKIGKSEVAIKYFEKAISVGRNERDKDLEVGGLISLGTAHEDLGDPQSSIAILEQALKEAQNSDLYRRECFALSEIGLVYRMTGNYEKSAQFLKRSLDIGKRFDPLPSSSSLLNLSASQIELKEFDQAHKNLELALTISKVEGDIFSEGKIIGELGNLFFARKDYQGAISYFEQRVMLAAQIGDRRGEGTGLSNLGSVYQMIGDSKNSMRVWEKAIQINAEVGDKMSEAILKMKLAAVVGLGEEGDIYRAIDLAKTALTIFNQVGNVQYAKMTESLLSQLQRKGSPADSQAEQKAQIVNLAFQAFQHSNSLQAMQAALEQFPFMIDDGFIQAVERTIKEQVPPNLKPAFDERLSWLKQIAGKQKPSFFGGLFGKK